MGILEQLNVSSLFKDVQRMDKRQVSAVFSLLFFLLGCAMDLCYDVCSLVSFIASLSIP